MWKSMSAPANVTEVSFGQTVSLPGYESVRIDLKAQVRPDEDWRAVLAKLKAYVKSQAQHVKDEHAARNG